MSRIANATFNIVSDAFRSIAQINKVYILIQALSTKRQNRKSNAFSFQPI